MTTDEETDEYDDRVPIEPKRMVFADLFVLAAGFAHNICEAFMLSLTDAMIVFGAHANYRKKEAEEKRAVAKFMAELDALPTK